MQPCGTRAAYIRHRRNGETPCPSCLEAERNYQRSRYVPTNIGKPCALCANPITEVGRKRYCSAGCAHRAFVESDAYKRAQAKRNASPRPRVERTCAHCGKSWMLDPHSKSRFCSISCAKTAEPSGNKRRCRELVHVGPADFSWLPSDHPVIKWASRLERAPLPRDWWTMLVAGVCTWCGSKFVAKSSTGTERYCSTRCQRANAKGRGGRRFNPSPILRTRIYERDQWTCQLCREPVEPGATDIWRASLDHIVPQSAGGSHDEANLRLAHLWCNSVRGDCDRHSDLFAA